MKRSYTILGILVFLSSVVIASNYKEKKLKVITAYPWIASLTKQIGMDLIQVESLADGRWDPHTVVPRPSYIAKLRNADLLITNGAGLEIAWMPPLLKQSNNFRLTGNGTLVLSHFVKLQEIPQNVSRSQGDVHPEGNPHFMFDPDNVILMARAIRNKLSDLDSAHSKQYQKNMRIFIQKWRASLKKWNAKMATLKGTPVIQYHKLFHYLVKHFGLLEIATVERLPGIPPTAQHLANLQKLIQRKNIKMILQDVYNSDKASKLLAKKLNMNLIYLPHDVGATPEAKGIFSLFDEIVNRLSHD